MKDKTTNPLNPDDEIWQEKLDVDAYRAFLIRMEAENFVFEISDVDRMAIIVANYYGFVSGNPFKARSNERPNSTARNLAIYAAKTIVKAPIRDIVKSFDMSEMQVHFAISRVENKLSIDPDLKEDLKNIEMKWELSKK